MVETLVQTQRAGLNEWWNTQDYASAVEALAAFDRRSREGAARAVTVRAGGRTLILGTGALTADSAFPLTGLLKKGGSGSNLLRLHLSAAGSGAPIYYYATVLEVPKERPVRPEDAGIKVERWYERFDRDEPVSTVAEGELVRVRLRGTLPADRQFGVGDDALPAGLEAVDLSPTASRRRAPHRPATPAHAGRGGRGRGGRAGEVPAVHVSWEVAGGRRPITGN
jgi:hypothetical protein